MSKRRRHERGTGIVTQASRTGVTATPATPVPFAPPEKYPAGPRRLWLALLWLVLGAGGVLVLIWYFAPLPAPSPTRSEQICREFMALKNADDPRADDLLGPIPEVPDEPAAAKEIQRLDAEFILRRQYKVKDVRPLGTAPDSRPRFVLVLEGSVYSEPMVEKTPTGTSKGQRIMTNPDVIVEVDEFGKIRGLKARLHEDEPPVQQPRRR
jgi:hypothetical protein